MKYQYVIFQSNNDYYNIISKGTEFRKEAVVVHGLFNVHCHKFEILLERIYHHFAKKTWAKKLFIPFLFHENIKGEKPVCFIVFACFANDVHLYLGKYLRRKYPNCKLVCRFEDIIHKMPYENIEEYRNDFDLLISFDKMDALRHGIHYFPSWYDKCEDLKDEHETLVYDFLFIGRGKDRVKEIISLYNRLIELGYKCFFYLVDVPDDMKINDKIIYGERLPYETVLKFVLKSKCLVEILQKDAESETLRIFEALFYNKKIITNNKLIRERPYFNPNDIYIYDKVDEINKESINLESKCNYGDNIIKRYKPITMMKRIDSLMSNDETFSKEE